MSPLNVEPRRATTLVPASDGTVTIAEPQNSRDISAPIPMVTGALDLMSLPKGRTPIPPHDGPRPGEDLPRQLPLPGFSSAPPPAYPEPTSHILELQKQNGELISRLGAVEKGYQQELAQLRMRLDVRAAAEAGPTAHAQIPLPPKIDPTQPVTVAEFYQIMGGLAPRLEAAAVTEALRASWNITTEEERAALTSYPELSQIEEPKRSRLIQQAVVLARTAKVDSGSAASNPAAPHVEGKPTRAVGDRVVPLVETGSPQAMAEPRAGGEEFNRVRLAYEKAKSMPQRTQKEAADRREAMRVAYHQYLTVTGGEEAARAGFIQRG